MKFKKNARLFRLMAVFIALSLLIAPDAFSFSGSFDPLKHQSALFPVGLHMFNRFNLLLDELSLPNPVNAARKKQNNDLQYSDNNKKKENVLSAENKRIETNITVLAVGEIDFAINISQGEWNQDLLGKTNGLCTIIPQTSGNQLQCQGTVGDKIFMVDFTIASGEEFLVQLFSGTALVLMPSTISGNRADDKLEPDTQAMNQMKQLFLEQQREYSKVRQSIKIRERLLKRKNNWKSKNDEVKKVAQRTKFLNGENIFIKGDESDPDHQGHSIKFKMPEQVFVSVNGTVLELGEQYQGVLPPGIVLIPIDSKTAKTDSGATPNNQDWKNRPVPSTHTCGVCPTCRTRCDAKAEKAEKALQMNLDRQLSNAKFTCPKSNGEVEGLVNLNKHQCQKQVLEDTCSQQTPPLEFTAYTDLCPDCQESRREAPAFAFENLPELPRRRIVEYLPLKAKIALASTNKENREFIKEDWLRRLEKIKKLHFVEEGDSLWQKTESYFSDSKVIDQILTDNRIPKVFFNSICKTPFDRVAFLIALASNFELHPQYYKDVGYASSGRGVMVAVALLSDGSVVSANADGRLITRTPEGDIKSTELLYEEDTCEYKYTYEESYTYTYTDSNTDDDEPYSITKIIDFPPGFLLVNKMGELSIGPKVTRLRVFEGGVRDEAVSEHACAIDENHFAMASGNNILIWEVDRRRSGRTCTSSLKGHEDSVSALIKLPRGQLASGGSDGNIMIWDVDQTRPVHTLTGHGYRVTSLAAVSDSLLVSGDTEGNLILWDVDQGRSYDIRKAHEDEVEHLLRLPDGRLMSATSDSSGSEVKTWNIREKKLTEVTASYLEEIQHMYALAPDMLVIYMRAFPDDPRSYSLSAIELWKLYQPKQEALGDSTERTYCRFYKRMQEDCKKLAKSPKMVKAMSNVRPEFRKKE